MKQHLLPTIFICSPPFSWKSQAQAVKGCFITIIGKNGERLQKWLKWASLRQEEVRRR